MGALMQCKKKKGEPCILEWLFTTLQLKTTIQRKIEVVAELVKKGWTRALQITGQEPSTVYLPMKCADLDWYLQHSPALQKSLLSWACEVRVKSLAAPTLRWVSQQEWLEVPKRSDRPLVNAITVFTDAGKKSQRAAATWLVGDQWHHQLIQAVPGDSLQTLELRAVV